MERGLDGGPRMSLDPDGDCLPYTGGRDDFDFGAVLQKLRSMDSLPEIAKWCEDEMNRAEIASLLIQHRMWTFGVTESVRRSIHHFAPGSINFPDEPRGHTSRISDQSPQGPAPGAVPQSSALPVRDVATLPPTVGHLTSLQRIMIEFNELTELPKEICMPQLQRLYIAYNKLTSLPDCIGEITALNDIWLRGNSIATIPDSFCKLRQHISGYMMMAGIQHLPDCIGDVPFSFLYLYGNELSELPDSMQQIYAAHDGFELSLADNQLQPALKLINSEGWSILMQILVHEIA